MKRLVVMLLIIITSQLFYAQNTTDEMDPPYNLQLEENGNDVHLSWVSPEAIIENIIADSFETYPDFATEFAPWITLDLDGYPSYGWLDYDWPNEQTPMAYIVFNPSATNPPVAEDLCHSGSKFLAAFSIPIYPSDDWLISPTVHLAEGGELSFWARSYIADYGLERFKVGVSTGSTDPAQFDIISGASYVEAPTQWTCFSYDLSAYAGQDIRVGIRCVSHDAYIFMLDDLEVFSIINAPQRELLAFRIYRNGELLSQTVDPSITTFDDLGLEMGEYEYTVTALYSSGESLPAGPVTASIDGELLPPRDLSCEVENNDVYLTWQPPTADDVGEWITWSDLDCHDNAVGTGSTALFDVAQMFDADDLAEYQDLEISMVKFVPCYADCIYTIKIWYGGSANAPGELVYSAPAQNISPYQWNVHALSAPIPIPTDRLWIGYEVNTQGGYPAGCDVGPAVEGKGNLINLAGWTTLSAYLPFISCNWSIQGFVCQGESQRAIIPQPIIETSRPASSGTLSYQKSHLKRNDRTLLAYNVYRDGTLLHSINDPGITEYVDENLPDGSYLYSVTAVYNEGESIPVDAQVEVNMQYPPVIYSEGFESYPDFATQMPPWTLVDGDQFLTYGLPAYQFPGNGEAMAFMVFNPDATNPPYTSVSAYEGVKMAACFATANMFNLDWLISPRISLSSNSMLRFKAKTHDDVMFGLGRIQVGVSTMPLPIIQGFEYITGPSYVEVPLEWTDFSFDLSDYDGQDVYICIKCVSYDADVLFVDDFAVLSDGVATDPFGEPVVCSESSTLACAVSINNQAVESGDVIAAFVDNQGSLELRGKATLISENGQSGSPAMQIYKRNDHELIQFRLWRQQENDVLISPQSLCTGHHFPDSWPDNPYPIDFGEMAEQEIALNPGWNLVSWNLSALNDTPAYLLSSIPSAILEFKGTDGIYIPDNPYSTLSSTTIGKAYSLRISAASNWSLHGSEVAVDTPIPLTDGWNMAGFLPSDPQPVDSALQNVMPWLEQVKGTDGIYIPGNPYSTLLSMEAGKGYWLRINGDHDLIYPDSPTQLAKSVPPAKPQKEVKVLPQSMGILLRCDWAAPGDLVLAKVEDELRGAERFISPQGFPAALLQVFTTEPGEEISLWIQRADGTQIAVANRIQSNPQQQLGEYPDFVVLEPKGNNPDLPQVSNQLKSCYPNPFNPSTTISFSIEQDDTPVCINVYNIRGQLLHKLVDKKYLKGQHQIVFEGKDSAGKSLGSGLYLIEFKAGSYRKLAKVMLAK